MKLLRAPLALSFVYCLSFLADCGGGSAGTGTPAALCSKSCDKISSLCFVDAGAFADPAKAACQASCNTKPTSTSTTNACPNSSAILAAYQACLDRVDTTCDQFQACIGAVPSCGGGTGGSSGGGTGGSSGGGTGGSSSDTGGTSGGSGGFFGFDGSIPGFDGSIPGFDGSIPGFDGSIPGFDGSISGTCADLLQCCNAMTSAQSKATCMSVYTITLPAGDGACGVLVTGYKQSGACP